MPLRSPMWHSTTTSRQRSCWHWSVLAWPLLAALAVYATVQLRERAAMMLFRHDAAGNARLLLSQRIMRSRYSDSGRRMHLVESTILKDQPEFQREAISLQEQSEVIALRFGAFRAGVPWSKPPAAGVFVLALVGAWGRSRARERRILSLPSCTRCRYDLASISASAHTVICPECGTKHERSSPSTPTPRPPRARGPR